MNNLPCMLGRGQSRPRCHRHPAPRQTLAPVIAQPDELTLLALQRPPLAQIVLVGFQMPAHVMAVRDGRGRLAHGGASAGDAAPYNPPGIAVKCRHRQLTIGSGHTTKLYIVNIRQLLRSLRCHLAPTGPIPDYT